jgi:hypothetical protein
MRDSYGVWIWRAAITLLIGIGAWKGATLSRSVDESTNAMIAVHEQYTKLLNEHSELLHKIEQAVPSIWNQLNNEEQRLRDLESARGTSGK